MKLLNEECLKKILSQVAKTYKLVYGNNLIDVYLYGSYARNNQQQDSDIDIVGIVDGERIDLQNKLNDVWDVVMDLNIEQDILISPTVLPLDEYTKYRDLIPYYHNIAVEGVKVSA